MLIKKNFASFILLVSCFIVFLPSVKVYGETSSSSKKTEDVVPEPYTEDEFPQWSKDLRRAEIVSLGTIPFAAVTVTMAYGGYQYATGKTSSFPNPLSRDNSYSKEEIFKLVGVSAGIGLTVGIVDFAINYSRRKKAEKEKALEDALQKENIRSITPEEAGELLKRNTKNVEEPETDDNTDSSPDEDFSSED